MNEIHRFWADDDAEVLSRSRAFIKLCENCLSWRNKLGLKVTIRSRMRLGRKKTILIDWHLASELIEINYCCYWKYLPHYYHSDVHSYEAELIWFKSCRGMTMRFKWTVLRHECTFMTFEWFTNWIHFYLHIPASRMSSSALHRMRLHMSMSLLVP